MKLDARTPVKHLARTLRSELLLPEVMLWQALRTRPGGFKFRRQYPAGPYIADFYCHASRLVLEVDGEAHERGDRPARDAVRDRWFEAHGVTVLRIAAREVLDNLDGVVVAIVEACKQKTHSVALRAPPPPEGKEQENPPPRGEVAARSADGVGL